MGNKRRPSLSQVCPASSTVRVGIEAACNSGFPPSAPLTDEDIATVLDTADETVTGLIYDIALAQCSTERERTASLDAKGGQLLGFVGAFASLAFSFGGLFLGTHSGQGDIWQTLIVVLAWGLSAALSLVALGFCFYAIRARNDFRDLNDSDIFRSEAVTSAGHDSPARFYKQYMIRAIRTVYSQNYTVNECKGRNLKTAQALFFISVCTLLLAALVSPIRLALLAAIK